MQNSSVLTKRKILQCLQSDCSCEKCMKLRLQVKHTGSLESDVRNKSGAEVVTNQENTICAQSAITTNTSANENPRGSQPSIYKIFSFPRFTMPTFKFSPHDFSSVLCDLVGIVSFFIMISIMFWISVSQYLWSLAKKLLQAERNTKLLALAAFLLLCASIIFHVLVVSHHCEHNVHLTKHSNDSVQLPNDQVNPPATVQRIPKRHKSCHHKQCFLCNTRKSNYHIEAPMNKKARQCEHKIAPSNGKSIGSKNPSLCELCAAKFKSEQISQPLLSDEEAREMYKKYKLYTVPSEMKFPPSFSCVLTALFEGLSYAANRTFF